MDTITLSLTTRTLLGRHARALRRTGSVPAILYGNNQEAVALSAEIRPLEKVWRRAGRTHIIEVSIDGGRARKALIRDFQIDPRSARPIHFDLYAVNLTEKLTTELPLVIVGEAPAVVAKHGQLLQTMTTIKVECLPDNLPSQLSVDVTGLAEMDDAVLVKDLPLPGGVTLVHTDPEETVVKIAALRVASDETMDAVGAATAAETGTTAEAAPSATA